MIRAMNLVRQGSIVVAVHLLPESLHTPVLCTSGGRAIAVTNAKARNAVSIGFMIILLVRTVACLAARDGHDS